MWDYIQQCVIDACVCKGCEPYVPVSILRGCSVFGDLFGHVEDTANENNLEIISLGSDLMWNYAAVYGGIMGLKTLARDSSEMWPSIGSPL